MKNSGQTQIAARYVSALFDVAKGASAVAEVEKDLRDLALAINQNDSLAEFIDNPLLSRKQQASIIAAIADGMKLHKITRGFLVTLAEAKRLGALVEVARQFVQKAQADRGEMSAELITAAPISKEQEKAFADHLGKAYGKKITLQTSQDASLLGGAVVKIGGVQLDSSLAGKLERMNTALKAA